MLRCDDCGSSSILGSDDTPNEVDHRILNLALSHLTRGYGDESRRLPETLIHLTRAIPDLHPLIALIERETRRKLST